MKISLLAALLLLPFITWAQQPWKDYTPLKSSGQVPKRFITSSSQKYQEEVKKNVSDKDARKVKKQKSDFLLESSFLMDEEMLSGKVLFNDPVGLYLNKVLDKLLKDDPKLRSELDIYVEKSPYVNAFTANNGVILVTEGLLARLQNEAQLAFVLSHEITHYKKKHVINKYLETQKIGRGQGVYRHTSMDDKLMAASRYSKDKEWEADREGLKLLLKSGYDIESLGGVFDILAFSNSTVYNIPFDKAYLETADFKFPKSLLPDSILAVQPDTAEEKYGSHPSVNVRKADLLNSLKTVSNEGKKKYLVSEEEFNLVKKTCQFDLCDVYLSRMSYRNCIYHSYSLLQQNPDNKYLQLCILRALYGLSKSKNYDDAEEFDAPDTTNAMAYGNIHTVQYLVDEMRPDEMNVVALAYGWKLEKQYPNDHFVASLTEDLSQDLARKNSTSLRNIAPALGSIYTEEFEAPKAGPDGRRKSTTKKDTYRPDLKNEGRVVKLEKGTSHDSKDSSFIKNSLLSFATDQQFTSMFRTAVKSVKTEKDNDLAESKKKLRKQQRNYLNKVKIHSDSKIDRVVFVNPFYYKFDERKKKAARYMASESAQHKLSEQIRKNAELAGIDAITLDNKKLTPLSTDTFNDIVSLNGFIDEHYNHASMPYKGALTEDLQKIRDKYKTDYLCSTGIVYVREKKEHKGLYLISLLYPPYIPFAIYHLAKPMYSTYFYCALFDLRTGERVHVQLERYKFADREDIVNASMYDLFTRYKKAK